MDDLNCVKRGEQKLYCFIEACESFFPDVSRSTVRLWLKNLGILTIYPTLDEKRIFKERNPKLKCSVFGLINEGDLKQLLHQKSDKRRPPKLVSYSDDESEDDNDVRLPLTPSSSTTPPVHLSSMSMTPETLCSPPSTSTISMSTSQPALTGTPEILSTSTSTSSTETPRTLPLPASASANQPSLEATTPPSTNGKRIQRRTPYSLTKEEAGDDVNNEVNNLRKFYTVELNAKRNGAPFAKQTIDKLIERIYCFLHFCSRTKNIPVVHLGLFNDDTLISEYVDYLSKERKLMPSTITAHLTGMINVIKYNLRDNWGAYDSCKAILSCRSFQRQLSRQARLITKRSKEGLCMKKASQRFYFNHILDTIRNLRAKIFETSGLQQARHLHDFVMLATYLRANPGRSKEIRTLQLFVESEENLFDPSLFLHTNVIVFRKDKTVSLMENDFKTVNSTGPRNIDLSGDQDLVYYLNRYNLARASLLQAKSHAHFFFNYSGEPFKDSSSVCKYLGDLFEREVSIRVSTNVLRHSIVTYFNTLEDSKDVKIRESLATLMKHSVRYQQETYDDTTSHQKTEPVRELLRTKLAPDIFGEPDVVMLHENSDDELVLRPNVGDICALLDPVSTATNISFYLAKVARFTSDKREAHLIHLGATDESETMFRLVPGKVWKESCDALLYPIDILYNSSLHAYELRTRPLDIYNMLHNK